MVRDEENLTLLTININCSGFITEDLTKVPHLDGELLPIIDSLVLETGVEKLLQGLSTSEASGLYGAPSQIV